MKITIEPITAVQKKLSFEIPPERVGEEIEKAYRIFQNTARVKGFRAGKAPRPLLERHFGEQVAAEVSSLLVEESYAKHSKNIASRCYPTTDCHGEAYPWRNLFAILRQWK